MKPIYCISLLLTNFVLAGEPDDAKVTFEDFNFDGHPDKKVFVSRGGGSSAVNEEFEISIYNPKTKTYEHNDQLSNLCNPEPDAKKKEIHSCVKDGPRGGQSEVYVWKGKDLVLTEQIRTTENGPNLIVVTERLVDGKLIVISREIEDAEGNLVSEQSGADQPATKPADKPPAEMALEDPKSIDATFELLLQNLHDYNNVESPWEDNHGDMEGSLTRLMEAEVNIWQIIESLPEGARGSSTASRVGTLLHEEFLCVATRAVKVFARHPNPRLLKLVIAHLEAYPYSWSAEGWDDLLSNLKKVQKPTPDKDKAKDAEQVVPSDGHKPSSRVPSDGPIAPADAH
jgi:hypothetical protein